MTAVLRVGLAGAGGRMGMAVRRAIEDAEGFELAGTLARGGNLGSLIARCDVVVDFSRPELLAVLAPACAEAGRPLVSGTTGLDDSVRNALSGAAERVPVVHAPNMSIGVNILLYLVEKTSETLSPDWRASIEETHHVHKRDAPSGTALGLGAAIERTRAVEYTVHREGEAVGHHVVRFDGPGERLALSHEALDRGIFAEGALRAARWVVSRPPGLYGMDRVLGLE